MDHLGTPGKTQHRLDVARIAPADLHRLGNVVGDEPAAELGGVLSIAFGPERSMVVTFAGEAASEISSRRS